MIWLFAGALWLFSSPRSQGVLSSLAEVLLCQLAFHADQSKSAVRDLCRSVVTALSFSGLRTGWPLPGELIWLTIFTVHTCTTCTQYR